MSINRKEASPKMFTKSQAKIYEKKQQNKQVTCVNASCFDDLSCHGSMVRVDKCSELGSVYVSRKSRAKSNIHTFYAKMKLLELQKSVLDKKRAYLLEQLKLEEHLASVDMNAKKEEKVLKRPNTPKNDTVQRVQSCLQKCCLTNQPNYTVEQERKNVKLVKGEVGELILSTSDELAKSVSLVTTSETEIHEREVVDKANSGLLVDDDKEDEKDDEDDAFLIEDKDKESDICKSLSTALQQELETRKTEDRKLPCSLAHVDKNQLNRFEIKPYNTYVCHQKKWSHLRTDKLATGDTVSKLEADVSLVNEGSATCNLNHTANISWSRPVVKPIEPSKDLTLVRQTELPTMRILEATEEGHSVYAYVLGSVPYFSVPVPKDLCLKHLADLRETLISSFIKDDKSRESTVMKYLVSKVNCEDKRNVCSYHGDRNVPFIRTTIVLPRLIVPAKSIRDNSFTFACYPLQYYSVFDANIEFEIRFMTDVRMIGYCGIIAPTSTCKLRNSTSPTNANDISRKRSCDITNSLTSQTRSQVEGDIIFDALTTHATKGDCSKFAPVCISKLEGIEKFWIPAYLPLLRVSGIVDECMLMREPVPVNKEACESLNTDEQVTFDEGHKIQIPFEGTKVVQFAPPFNASTHLKSDVVIFSSINGCIFYELRSRLTTQRGRLWETTLYSMKTSTANNVEGFVSIAFLLMFVKIASTYVWIERADQLEKPTMKDERMLCLVEGVG